MLGELYIADIPGSTCSFILETYMGEFDIPETVSCWGSKVTRYLWSEDAVLPGECQDL